MLPGERIDLIRAIYSSLKNREPDEAILILREFGFSVADPEYWDTDAASTVQETLRQGDDDTLVSLRDYVGGEVLERPVSAEAQRRIWSDGFRLFLTHTAAHASYVAQVKEKLKELGISAFVAHTDIEPPREWEGEIENALNSAEAVAAFTHEDFRKSPWTDQEVGHALGRGLLVVPLMHDEQVPHGFLNKFQAIKVTNSKPKPFDVAVQILDALVGSERIQPIIAPHLVAKFERAENSGRGESFLRRIARIRQLSPDLLERLDKAPSTNSHLASRSIRSDIDSILELHGYKRPPVSSGDLDEEPF